MVYLPAMNFAIKIVVNAASLQNSESNHIQFHLTKDVDRTLYYTREAKRLKCACTKSNQFITRYVNVM